VGKIHLNSIGLFFSYWAQNILHFAISGHHNNVSNRKEKSIQWLSCSMSNCTFHFRLL